MSQPIGQDDMDRINEALFAGKLIEAIKIYRAATPCDLKEAKDFIESLENRLRSEMPERFTAPQRKVVEIRASGCLLMLVVSAIAIVAIIVLITR
jgi:ribosomal protein L7/L12